MFDRRLEVAGHAGRQLETLLVGLLYPLVLGLQTRECIVGIGTERRDSHQPNERKALRGLRQRAQFVDEIGIPDVDSPTRDVTVEADL
jgi:hypothetical protein